jgi:hypothetical protein
LREQRAIGLKRAVEETEGSREDRGQRWQKATEVIEEP